MKKTLSLLLSVCVVLSFFVFAVASSSDDDTTEAKTQAGDTVTTAAPSNSELGDYKVEIKSSRLTKDYEGKPVIVITYGFTNNSSDASSFAFSVEDGAFQNGIGLSESMFLKDNDPYNSENQLKDIKKGATLDVEVAYKLNDSTTDVVVEVTELISFDDAKITKTFKLS